MASSRLPFAILYFLFFMSAAATVFEKEPQDKNATVGETVTLQCIRHQSQTDTVLWNSRNKQAYLSRDKVVRAAYRASGHYTISQRSPNDFSLTIHNVTEEDADRYQCVCFLRETYFSPLAQLRIFVPPAPQYPSCRITAPEDSLYVGQRLNFHCSSDGGKPRADLTWYRGKEELDTEVFKYPISVSMYRTYLQPQDFGMVYTCVATSPALKIPRKCTVGPLYPTSVVQVDIISELGSPELKPLSFGCSANFTKLGVHEHPPALNYSWYINDTYVSYGMEGVLMDNEGQIMFLNNTCHLPQYTRVSCEAISPYGTLGNATIIINENDRTTAFDKACGEKATAGATVVANNLGKNAVVSINSDGMRALKLTIAVIAIKSNMYS